MGPQFEYKTHTTTPPVIFCVDWAITYAKQLPELGPETLSHVFSPQDDFFFRFVVKRERSTNAEFDFDLVIYMQAVNPTPAGSEWMLSIDISATVRKPLTFFNTGVKKDITLSSSLARVCAIQILESRLIETLHFKLTSIKRKGDSAVPSGAITQQSTQGSQEHEKLLIQDLNRTLVDDSLLDFTLEITKQQVEVKASRLLLALRSPVFKRMIQSDMREASEHRIVIDDFDADTVKQFIAYIHTGNIKAQPDAKSNIQLLMIADKYDVSGLKTFASQALIPQIDSSSIYSILEHAVLIEGADDLCHACGNYVSTNFSAFKQHDNFKTLSVEAQLYLFRQSTSYSSR